LKKQLCKKKKILDFYFVWKKNSKLNLNGCSLAISHTYGKNPGILFYTLLEKP
jgi:hypothetical protein